MENPITLESVQALAQLCWLLVSSALVLFMQAGFCCVEAGTVRHKNSLNVAIKNIVDLCASMPAYFIVGYALMFGADIAGLIGQPKFFLSGVNQQEASMFLFQSTFCATAATIVSGAVAERCRFFPYVLVSMGVGLFIYPLFGHWVWGGGWLSTLGYHDFAGSSVVHMVGGGVALAGIQVLGPRQGKYNDKGESQKIAPSSMTLVATGTFILIFGWIGFNGGSAPLGMQTATIITNTILAACFGGLVAMLATWAYFGMASVDLILNGLLGGLVAITACADCLPFTGSAIVGILGGLSVVFGSIIMEKLKLDDAVGAVPVHFIAGIVGILCAGLLGDAAIIPEGQNRMQFVGVQALGALVCFVWSYAMGLILWRLTSLVSKLRVSQLEEKVGMNFSEHRMEDAVQELTGAVLAVSRAAGAEQRGSLAHSLFDQLHMRDSETTQLAQALKELVQRSSSEWATAESWTDNVDAVRKELVESRVQGAQTTQHCVQRFETLRQALENLSKYLTNDTQIGPVAPVLNDLLVGLAVQLSDITEKLPRASKNWEAIGQSVVRLERLKKNLRGAVR